MWLLLLLKRSKKQVSHSRIRLYMKPLSTEQKIYYTLRVASAMCFIGHGSFGIITKAVWCNYFAVFGIGHDMAYQLMPVLGIVDIIMGFILLFYPIRIIAIWLVIWAVITATLRPLSGESFGELLERAGNFGAPLAMLIFCGTTQGTSGLFQKLNAPLTFPAERLKNVQRSLRGAAALLFAGHGWLNLIDKKGLIGQYTSLGFHDVHQVAFTVGIFELAAALLILIKPSRPLVLVLLLWKMGTELFYPHYEIFEWVERGGSYGVLLALWLSISLKKEMRLVWAANS